MEKSALESPQFLDKQIEQLAGRQWNTIKIDKEFTVRRFYLDDATPEGLSGTSRHLVEFAFRSFWVRDTNDMNFVASMKIGGDLDKGDWLPLDKNLTVNFEAPVPGAYLKWDAQPGKWIDIVFAHNTILTPGNVKIGVEGAIAIDNGSGGTLDRVSMSPTAAVLITASDENKKIIIQNKLAVPIWIAWGSDAQTKLADANFKDKTYELASGNEFTCDNHTGSIYGRTEAVTGYVTAGYMR